jgi:hypothetical protein
MFLLDLLIFILILHFSAVCPYLALETCRQWRLSNKTVNLMRNGKMPTVTIEQAQRNFIKVRFSLSCLLSVSVLSIISLFLNIPRSNKEFDPLDPCSHVNVLLSSFEFLTSAFVYCIC